MPPTPDRNLPLSDICGTYELVFDSRILSTTERSELLISSDCKSLWGRFRFGDQAHGLFRTGRIPSRASTEPVQCQVAMQSLKHEWRFDIVGGENSKAAMEGLIFLGNGLVYVDSGCLSSDLDMTLKTPIFGVKTSQEWEEADALKDSWFAVHDSVCSCTANGPLVNGDVNPMPQSDWKPVSDGAEKAWDEVYVDGLIDRLKLSTTNGVTPAPTSL